MSHPRRILRIAVPVIALMVMGLTLSCQQQVAAPAAALEEMTALMERGLPIWNEGNLNLIDELYAPEFVRHSAGVGDVVGPDGMKGYVTELRTGFPDFNVTIDELMVADDKMVELWTVTGTNEGSFMEQPPTGMPLKISGVTIARVVNGLTVEEWVYWDTLAVQQQLGYTLTPPAVEEVVEE